MSNIQKLLNSKNKNQKLFATAIIDFKTRKVITADYIEI